MMLAELPSKFRTWLSARAAISHLAQHLSARGGKVWSVCSLHYDNSVCTFTIGHAVTAPLSAVLGWGNASSRAAKLKVAFASVITYGNG